MDVRQVLLARAIQMFRVLGTTGYLPEIAQKINDRYEFVSRPKNEELLPPAEDAGQPKGAEFKHGRIRRADGRVVIVHLLTLFNDGVVVDTTTSTDDSDFILDDLTHWAKSEIRDLTPLKPRLYVSHLEIQAAVPAENYAPAFGSLGPKISTFLIDYGSDISTYQVSAITLNFDQIGKVPPHPGVFHMERRLNAPFKDNMWFAQAPLKTNDHIALLHELEVGLNHKL
jgi:hypothetical protein